ncbi:MAG: hypothetical protein IPM64_00420 [Phycisphaerales bacterium]|nr:hypothetical protein [Phycisphaerales bacterium]
MGLFKSKQERAIERDIKIRQGIRRIEKAVAEQNKFADEFVRNARHAREIGDTAAYQFIRNSLRKTAAIRKLLERQLLAVRHALLVKRQAEAVADFSEAMSMMAAAVSELYGRTDVAKVQMNWEQAMARSQTMEERMGLFLDAVEQGAAADTAVSAADAVSDDELDRLIDAEDAAAQARDSEQISSLRAELDALRNPGRKETK